MLDLHFAPRARVAEGGTVLRLSRRVFFSIALFQNAAAVTIQFSFAPQIPLAPDPGHPDEYSFMAQANPGGHWWSTSAGTVILTVAPNVSARLVLTGTRGPDNIRGTADDPRFRIFYAPLAGVPARDVAIEFQSGDFPPIPAPVNDRAEISGLFQNVGPDAMFATPDDTVAGLTGAGARGIVLSGFTDAGKFCDTGAPFTGPDAPPSGFFTRACGPVPDPGPPVIRLTGRINFTFGAGNLAGDSVLLPGSAEVEAQGYPIPEPGTRTLFGAAAAACLALHSRRRNRR
jgi:hypothetical protein